MTVDVGSIDSATSSGQGALSKIGTQVLKQIQDSQKQQAQALVGMINQNTQVMRGSLQAGVGQNIDIAI